MALGVNRSAVVLGLLAVAFWPLAPWCLERSAPPADKLCALLSLATACGFLWRDRREFASADRTQSAVRLRIPAILITLYALSVPLVSPPLGVLAVVFVITVTLSLLRYRVFVHVGIGGLLLLSLPILSRLQFYLGYPLRVASGAVAAGMLRLAGFSVAREGAVLYWNGKWVAVDAPCSGAKMLWAGLYLACALACLYRLDARRSILAIGAAAATILLANALRTSTLLWMETCLAEAAGRWHDAVGAIIFVAAAIALLAAIREIRRRWPPCAT